MNLKSDLESELALAVLIEKKHSEKIGSEEILPLIKRLHEALELISEKDRPAPAIPFAVGQANQSSH